MKDFLLANCQTMVWIVAAIEFVMLFVLAAEYKKQKTPHLFLSGFLMFAFSALGPATGNFDHIFFITMIGEVLMVLFFWFYAKKQRK